MIGGARRSRSRAATTAASAPWLGLAAILILLWAAQGPLIERVTDSDSRHAARLSIVVDPGSGAAFLGTQGDEWDAQKDLLCAASGAMVGGAVEAVNRLYRSRPWKPTLAPG